MNTDTAITGEAIRRGHQVLAHLMTVNTGMGHAVRRMNDFAIEHGHLPVDELRTLAELLDAVAGELREYADQLDRPVVHASS